MVDILALALSHGLLLLAAWRLLWRAELDVEPRHELQPPPPAKTDRPPMRRAPRAMKLPSRPQSESDGDA